VARNREEYRFSKPKSQSSGVVFTVSALDELNQVLTSNFVLVNSGAYPYLCVRTPTGGNLGNGAG
jgi:hypothetical protein